MNVMLNGDDLKNLLGDDLRIIKFQDLKNYSNIYQVLPRKIDYAVIFFTDNIKNDVNIGHWTCIMRYKNKFQFFDSYGLREEDELKFISKEKRRKFGEEIDYLKNLFKDVDHSYNKIDYQKWDDGVNTCGRFVVLRLYLFKNGIYTDEEFYDIMKKKVKKFGGDYDLMSVYYT
jgi:hypothetical protein